MVVVGIIAIISAASLPSYQRYVLKTKIATALNIVATYNNQLVAHYTETGILPDSIASIGLTPDPLSAFGESATVMPTTVEQYLAPSLAQFVLATEYTNHGYCPMITTYATISDLDSSGAVVEGNYNSTYINIAFYNVDVDGIMKSACVYYYYENGTTLLLDERKIESCYSVGNGQDMDDYLDYIVSLMPGCT